MNRHTIVILAYDNHELTLNNLTHLISLGYGKNILLFDNGSSPSFEKISNKLNIRYHRQEQNLFVNPAWNKIFDQENCKYLTLLNNDCFILTKNYFEDVIEHMEKYKIGISSCKNKNILKLKKDALQTTNYFIFNKEAKPLKCNFHARRQGWLMTLNLEIYKTLDYKIPNYLKLWYGDDWIWSQFALNNLKMGVYSNRYSIHIRSSSISSTQMQKIVEDDISNLETYGKWYHNISPIIHKRTRIFSRYV
jgi:hypothetical protein